MQIADIYAHENLDQAVSLIRQQCGSAGSAWAMDVQSRMRAGAPWTDRNGPSMDGRNARQSLECEAGMIDADTLQIVARSTRMTPRPWREFPGAPVGAFLELSTRHMVARPIIRDTVNKMAPRLASDIKKGLKNL